MDGLQIHDHKRVKFWKEYKYCVEKVLNRKRADVTSQMWASFFCK